MGQYYFIANTDKGESISPFALDGRLKLLEFAYTGGSTVSALMNLLAKRWQGDHVYVVGDYAAADNSEEPYHKVIADLEKRCELPPIEIGRLLISAADGQSLFLGR